MKVELLFITPNAEKLIETAGRTSYLSFNKQERDSEKAFIMPLMRHSPRIYFGSFLTLR